jgi:hypothetical protein
MPLERGTRSKPAKKNIIDWYTRTEIVHLYDSDLQPPTGRIERNACTSSPSPDNKQIKIVILLRSQRRDRSRILQRVQHLSPGWGRPWWRGSTVLFRGTRVDRAGGVRVPVTTCRSEDATP